MSPLKGALLAPTPALPAASPTLSPVEHLSAPAMVVRAVPVFTTPRPKDTGLVFPCTANPRPAPTPGGQ